MKKKDFLSKNVGKEIPTGLVSIDLEKHSELKGTPNDIANTRTNFFDLVSSQITSKYACRIPPQGDGVIILFDLTNVKYEEIVTFADRVLQLLPFFNRTRGELNKLSPSQALSARIVCHCGNILNIDGTAASLYGPALNLLGKREREIGVAGYVVISNDIYIHLSKDFKKRCSLLAEHTDFGNTYILDGSRTFTTIIKTDQFSSQLKEWLLSLKSHRKFTRLLYFAYTNELLFEFLASQLSGIDIKIIIRNWVVEKKDEDYFNKQLQSTQVGISDDSRRFWFKSSIIKTRASDMMSIAADYHKSVDMRFYDSPPLFNGAILEDDIEPSCAYIGLSKWVELPEKGGSQYKLEEWPAIILDAKNKIQQQLIENLRSRFWEIWEKGHTYEEILKEEEKVKSKALSVVGKVWDLSGKPYLIIYPHRKAPDRKFPVVAHEDVMAFHTIESFLNECGINNLELSSFQVPDPNKIDDNWYPEEIRNKIDNFEGHVVYLCSWSLLWIKQYLLGIGFPYDIVGVGNKNTTLIHLKEAQMSFKSPSDEEPPQPRDYSIIARFIRPNNKGFGYITAGIRAMGTWGAVHYLSNRDNINILSQMMENKQFAAMVETTFDPDKYKVLTSRLCLAPEEF